jgi:phosphatidylinositol-3-phosphatase
MRISEYTLSAWTAILRERSLYLNPFYNEKSDKVLQPNNSCRHIKLWKNYYCRYMPGYRSTLVRRFFFVRKVIFYLFRMF